MKIVFAAGLLFLHLTLFSQQLTTTFTTDLSRWQYDGLSFRTQFNDDWDNWSCDGTLIRTNFNNDWDSWKIGNDVTLKTVFSNDFNSWEIIGYDKRIRVSVTFIDDLERWTISGDADGSINTVFSNNYERWTVSIDQPNLEEELEMAILFKINGGESSSDVASFASL